jgi:hypothetical protein
MPRAPTTADAFKVIAEPRPRQMTASRRLAVLAGAHSRAGGTQESERDTTMSACCDASSDGKTRSWVRRVREIFAWVLPSAILVLLPKCPACLAAHVTLWTGLGLSLSAATSVRWVLLFLGVASLIFLTVERLDRIGSISSYFKKETEQCNTK